MACDKSGRYFSREEADAVLESIRARTTEHPKRADRLTVYYCEQHRCLHVGHQWTKVRRARANKHRARTAPKPRLRPVAHRRLATDDGSD